MSLRANRIDVVSQQREQWGCPTNDCIISTESSKKVADIHTVITYQQNQETKSAKI